MLDINRRTFIGSATSAVFTAPWKADRLGIVCSSGNDESSARKALAAVRHAGFDLIQLQIPWGKVDDTFLKKMPGWLNREGIRAEVLGAYVNCCEPENVIMDCRRSDFERAIRFAGTIGARRIVAWTGGFGADLMKSDPKNFTPMAEENVCRFVESYTKSLENHGLQLALETYITLTCPDALSLSNLLKRLPRCVGAVMDPPNLTPIDKYEQRDEVLAEMFRLLEDRIALIHLKDFRLAADGRSYQLPGPLQGEMNYRLFIDKIKSLPQQIPIIAEHLAPDRYREARSRLLSLF